MKARQWGYNSLFCYVSITAQAFNCFYYCGASIELVTFIAVEIILVQGRVLKTRRTQIRLVRSRDTHRLLVS